MTCVMYRLGYPQVHESKLCRRREGGRCSKVFHSHLLTGELYLNLFVHIHFGTTSVLQKHKTHDQQPSQPWSCLPEKGFIQSSKSQSSKSRLREGWLFVEICNPKQWRVTSSQDQKSPLFFSFMLRAVQFRSKLSKTLQSLQADGRKPLGPQPHHHSLVLKVHGSWIVPISN